MTDVFDDPDRAVQVEDDDPESLAGEPVEFDPETGGEGLPGRQPEPQIEL